ncbi:unnamed protein product [Rotaria sordida]|uniref:G-protein coupled receptors family 1 profile domain-containing protein n=1 Tax=Rotaria sordida TaxID=392033 RepID=A0A814MBS6_9BILA|nr:unnamed protein product [Rotaria sordida]CAF1284723.1 unnamed protein product [Rotaria sordida]CAF1394720.1 unnamed protein product [Rotaria sordida]
MKSYESILAFLCGRRICRLSWSIFQLAVYSRRTSIFISFLSIVSLLSSVAAVQQQQVVNQQEQRTLSLSSIISTNGTSTTTTTVFNNSRRRTHTTMSLLSSTILPTTTITTAATITINDELINNTNNSIHHENNTRHLVHLTIIIIICSLMCILTIVGNLVVILAVSIVRKLQTASNILIVSLAVSDVFVGLFIMPLALVLEISNNTWLLGSAMCDIWTSTDVLLCTSSILNFLVISIDRYCIINHPFKYAPMRKVKLLSLMIAGVWILSALVSLPPILGWGRPSENLPICQVNPKLAYQIFATMLSFYIPLIIVLIIYANIYRTARTAMDPRSSVQMSQFLTNNSSSPNAAHTSEVLDQQLNGNSCSTPQLYLSVSNANTHDDNLLTSDGNRTSKRSENSPPQRSKSATLLSPTRCLGRRISTTINGRLSIFVARRYSIFRHVHLPNQKAIRTLGVILGTFIVCWLPFMLFAIIKPLHERITGLTGPPKPLNAPPWIDSVLLWFGYSSSMLNPLIYSKFNREFRTPFREIIYCRCKGLNEKIRRQEYLENLYGENHLQLPVSSHVATTTRSSGNPKSAV